jgi:hypothetical protein
LRQRFLLGTHFPSETPVALMRSVPNLLAARPGEPIKPTSLRRHFVTNRFLLATALIALCGIMTSQVASAGWITLGPGQSWSGGNWTPVNNGKFESGLSGWTLVGAGGTFSTVASPVVYTGNSGRLVTTNNFTGNGYGVKSSIAISGLTVGTEYVLSGFLDARQLNSGDLYLDLDDKPTNLADPTAWAPIGQTGFAFQKFTAWTTSVNVRIVRDSNYINGGVGGSKSTNPGGTVLADQIGYFDEVSITLASNFVAPTAVPEPSSVACISGLVAGLSVLSRRRCQA